MCYVTIIKYTEGQSTTRASDWITQFGTNSYVTAAGVIQHVQVI